MLQGASSMSAARTRLERESKAFKEKPLRARAVRFHQAPRQVVKRLLSEW
jgi:hypothetical protein